MRGLRFRVLHDWLPTNRSWHR